MYYVVAPCLIFFPKLFPLKYSMFFSFQNFKAYFRGAKAAVALESFEEAAELCTAGIEYDRTNMELLELKKIIDKKFSDAAEHKRKEALVVSEAEVF